MEKLPLSTTLEEAKAHLRKNYTQGVKCPCCDQFVKMYRRPITSAMAYALILFYKESVRLGGGFPWIHADNFFKGQDCPPSIRGDFPKLANWELIFKDPKEQGIYRMTYFGEVFVKGLYKVESHKLIYNNKCYGAPDNHTLISIKDALKKKFDYEKLMSNTL